MQKLSIRCIITNHDSAMLMRPLFKAIQSIFSMWWISSEPALFVHRCRKSKSRCRFKKNRWKPLPCDGEAFRKRISLNYYGQRFNKYLGHAGWLRVAGWLADRTLCICCENSSRDRKIFSKIISQATLTLYWIFIIVCFINETHTHISHQPQPRFHSAAAAVCRRSTTSRRFNGKIN